MTRQKWCTLCYGSGVMHPRSSKRWVKCICKRLVNSVGAARLAKQEKLDKRMQEVKEGKW